MLTANFVPLQHQAIPIATSGASLTDVQLNPSRPTPVDIVFRNLAYSKTVKHKNSACCRPVKCQEIILDGVSGIAKHGKVTAIMGASGAGKTTLMNILAKRVRPKKNFHLSGQVLANMQPYTYENFGGFACYIMQADLLMETLTVKESLEFAAALKINGSVKQRNLVIHRLIYDLKLEECMDVRIGSNFSKGVSGGEKKRTALAF